MRKIPSFPVNASPNGVPKRFIEIEGLGPCAALIVYYWNEQNLTLPAR